MFVAQLRLITCNLRTFQDRFSASDRIKNQNFQPQPYNYTFLYKKSVGWQRRHFTYKRSVKDSSEKRVTILLGATLLHILEEIIWNNRFIRINGYSVYYKQWREAGITKVSDIFKGDSLLTVNNYSLSIAFATRSLKNGSI